MAVKKQWVAVLAVLLLTGCGSGNGRGGTVHLDGSTAMSGVMAVLQEAFREIHPEIQINCSGSGSGAGVEAALSGTCDIGLASRGLTEDELSRGARAQVIAWDEIAVIVHPDNPVRELSAEILAQIFTGQLHRWTEAGGEDRPIAVYGREAGSGTRDAFEEGLDIVDQCAYTNEYCSTGDVTGNVSSNPNAIGYASRSTVNETVSALAVDCALQRPFLLVTKEDAPLSETAEAFFQFARSGEAAPYILLAGVRPPEEEGRP